QQGGRPAVARNGQARREGEVRAGRGGGLDHLADIPGQCHRRVVAAARGACARAGQRWAMDRLSLLIPAALVGLAGLAGYLCGQAAEFAGGEPSAGPKIVAVSQEPVKITINQGESPGTIALKLERAGVVGNAEHFGALAGLMGVESQLTA